MTSPLPGRDGWTETDRTRELREPASRQGTDSRSEGRLRLVGRYTNQQLMTLALAADQAARRARERGDVREAEACSREVAALLRAMH